MAENSGIEWTDDTFNPWVGCTKISPACDHCLAPDTRILMADFTYRKIGSLAPGDVVIGYPESPDTQPTFVPSVVEKVWRIAKPAIRVRTEHASIVASEDHLFRSRIRPRWRMAENLTLQSKLQYIGEWDCPPPNEDHWRGYIAGLTHGDGTMRWDASWSGIPTNSHPQCYWRVAVHEGQRDMLESVSDYLASCGVDAPIRGFDGGGGGFGQVSAAKAGMLKIETRAKPALEKISAIIEEADSPSYKAGWIGGFFDAEGTSGYKSDGRVTGDLQSIRIANTAPDRLQRVITYGNDIGLSFKIEKYSRHCSTARLELSQGTRMKFLGCAQSKIAYKRDHLLGRLIDTRDSLVNGIERVGHLELVDIQTSTRTFVANGLLTHNCYAEAWAKRGGTPELWQGERRRTTAANWNNPNKWNVAAKRSGVRRKVFCASLADVFDNQVPTEWRSDLWELIARTSYLDWLVLTKRPQNIRKMLPAQWGNGWPNVWLGATVENRQEAERRIPILQAVPAHIRFLSIEPMLEAFAPDLRGIDWVICGGESGGHARLMEPDWARALRDHCAANGAAFFFKQMTRKKPIPADLMVRQFPSAALSAAA